MIVQLRSRLNLSSIQARKGKPVLESDVVMRLDRGDVDLYRPDGEPLVLVRRGALSKVSTERAYPALRGLRTKTTLNRGMYGASERTTRVFADGVVSRSSQTRPVASAIVGYFDRQGGRFPYCRATAFTGDEVEAWTTVLPLVGDAAAALQRALPHRYGAQMAMVRRTRPEYVIHVDGKPTPFTTLTVNNNVAPSGMHTDKGDFKDGFGVIGCVRRGSYRGGLLVFPEFGAGVDLHDGDLVLFNSHDWHGVTAMEDASEDAERITVVFYFRERMTACKSPAEELRHAKLTRGKIPA